MECEIYSMENLRIVSAICSLLESLALPKEVDEKLLAVEWACSKHLNVANLVGKDINAED